MKPKTLLDSDVLSAVFRGHPVALQAASDYMQNHSQLTFSVITRYEILRGLRAVNASRKLQTFDQFCAACEILPITDSIVDRAASIYADLHRRGLIIGDADILIASTALEHGLEVATNNLSHFRRVAGLRCDTWL